MCQNNTLPISVTKSYLLATYIVVKSESCAYLTKVVFPELCDGATGVSHILQ